MPLSALLTVAPLALLRVLLAQGCRPTPLQRLHHKDLRNLAKKGDISCAASHLLPSPSSVSSSHHRRRRCCLYFPCLHPPHCYHFPLQAHARLALKAHSASRDALLELEEQLRADLREAEGGVALLQVLPLSPRSTPPPPAFATTTTDPSPLQQTRPSLSHSTSTALRHLGRESGDGWDHLSSLQSNS